MAELDCLLCEQSLQYKLGAEIIITDKWECVNRSCKKFGHKLHAEYKEYMAHLYTLRRGILPAQIITLYCRECKTTYRPNYSVCCAERDDSCRRYLSCMPRYLEVVEHCYIESELAQLFATQMAFSHASGEAIARIYNLSINTQHNDDCLSSETIWNTFYLYALLRDCVRQSIGLVLPHRGSHKDRLNARLLERNLCVAGTGQEQWAHVCRDCVKVIVEHDGSWSRITACVMDGVTVGHPRCNVANCIESLASLRDRFCPIHANLHMRCQLMVRCCGIIISRVTFFHAESLVNAMNFILATFPARFPHARPSYLFFDNNCHLLQHLIAAGEHRLDTIGFPVDVFHAINKHKDSDAFCQMHCNPAGFPELYDEHNQWTFNSSAAEQANVWFGKFQSITREMTKSHYNFFLDEMINIRNAFLDVQNNGGLAIWGMTDRENGGVIFKVATINLSEEAKHLSPRHLV
ncbi:uncharacterized protein LAESUDRAFT_736147 [Laetiporus sulphureus 93-53]|uniref:CxC6 like cysteine cluster associated with KDZ domain-containing protein n=1 Tax=Laetiporus sulphureus 93-53 TaxID=1314785 RepID=A0A165EVR4_9APHY|nr:uncharacterized protein LAESUDRAFT_736147 [Laetiporus sulphureus 93-53]KZT07866.1 hypothetical protein LAESUDRAFT_736147 [Laetiporus sulphureus 93-53]